MSLSLSLARSITIEAKFLVQIYSSDPSHLGTLHCFISPYSGMYVWSSSCTIVIGMGSLLLHHVGTLLILTLWCSISRRTDKILFGVMISAMSFPWGIRSIALHMWVVVILMLPAPEYPTAITWKYWGISFFSSILLIFLLVLILFSLSSALMLG